MWNHSPMAAEDAVNMKQLRIDSRLDAGGWQKPPTGTLPLHEPYRTEEEETDHGPADYVLWLDGHPVAIVAAKKGYVESQHVLAQAERHARGFRSETCNSDGLRVPFHYAPNGRWLWFRDVRHALSRTRVVSDFHTPSALRNLLGRDLEPDGQSLQGMDHHPWLRPNEIEATTAVETAIAERDRDLLVVMPTRSEMIVSMTYRLLKSGAAGRVLVLADRRDLVDRTARAFGSLDVEPGRKMDEIYEIYSRSETQDLPVSHLTDPPTEQPYVYVSTIQGLCAIFGCAAEDQTDIPIDAFDVVIATECHRGYTALLESVWRDTLNHFDAIRIGISETPKAETVMLFKHVAYPRSLTEMPGYRLGPMGEC